MTDLPNNGLRDFLEEIKKRIGEEEDFRPIDPKLMEKIKQFGFEEAMEPQKEKTADSKKMPPVPSSRSPKSCLDGAPATELPTHNGLKQKPKIVPPSVVAPKGLSYNSGPAFDVASKRTVGLMDQNAKTASNMFGTRS